MRTINTIIIHQTNLPPMMGDGRTSTTYHALIHPNGTVELGLALDQCTDLPHRHRDTSLDVSLYGYVPTEAQDRALKGFISQLMRQYPILTVHGGYYGQPL